MDNGNKTTKVQLSLHASKLPNVAGAFKGTSDPFAVVTLLAADANDKPVVLGKTEVIKNSLSPRWTEVFLFDYELGKPLHVNVGIYDEVRKSKRDKAMGSAMFEIGEVLGSKGSIKAKRLKRGGTLFARVEKAKAQSSGELSLCMRGVKLKNVEGFLGKSDPFFELSRRVDGMSGNTWSAVYRSKHVNNDLNPIWETAKIDLDRLCDGDMERPVLISVFDWEKNGKHQAMGTAETNVSRLISAATDGATGKAKSVDTSKAFKVTKRGKKYGLLVVTSASVVGGSQATRPSSSPSNGTASHNRPAAALPTAGYDTPTAAMAGLAIAPVPVPFSSAVPEERPTFVDYINGGCELQMCVAIDFTGSNGDPRIPGTLHHIHRDGTLNDYEKAITAIGSIIAKYDADQKFPVWGFGAKFGGVVRHCFQVGHSSEVNGIGGVLEAYRSVFQTPITMSGPTVFSEVISIAASQALSAQKAKERIGQQTYTILLILTDGAVTDVNTTKAAISAASGAPLSIVIVGVGHADFAAMRFLDDFETRRGRERDIVQFVEFEAHKHSKTSLTRATLEEIPQQLVDFFYNNGIKPLPKLTQSKLNLVPEEHNEETDIDLSLDIDAEGEITLTGNDGLYVSDSYASEGQYAGLTVLPPPTAPGANSAAPPFNPSASVLPPPTAPGANPAAPPFNPSASVVQPHNGSGRQSIAVSPTFQVQVPAGVFPGTQLQVQNPVTGQMMMVVVPEGAPPGGVFNVTY